MVEEGVIVTLSSSECIYLCPGRLILAALCPESKLVFNHRDVQQENTHKFFDGASQEQVFPPSPPQPGAPRQLFFLLLLTCLRVICQDLPGLITMVAELRGITMPVEQHAPARGLFDVLCSASCHCLVNWIQYIQPSTSRMKRDDNGLSLPSN